jgi:hypothetical protein
MTGRAPVPSNYPSATLGSPSPEFVIPVASKGKVTPAGLHNYWYQRQRKYGLRTLQITSPLIDNLPQAQAQAEGLLRFYDRFTKTATITIPGDPRIRIGTNLRLVGELRGRKVDRTYYIDTVAHEYVEGDHYDTTLTLTHGRDPWDPKWTEIALPNASPQQASTPSGAGIVTNSAATGAPAGGVPSSQGVWLPGVKQLYSPGLDIIGPRATTSGIVIHVNVGYYANVVSAFAAGGYTPGIGAHFEVGDPLVDGPPVQFVPLDRIVQHAGQANAFSIGIEHAGFGASRQEWLTGHGTMLTVSAQIAARILRDYGLGAPNVNTSDPTPARSDGSPAGNIWPHNLGTLLPFTPPQGAWGGHSCPDGPNGIDYFPWDVWTGLVNDAYGA